MKQSQFVAITCNSLKAREKWRVHGVIGFGFASHWLKNWRESLKPITKRSDGNHVITFDSHLETTLFSYKFVLLLLTKIKVPIVQNTTGFFLMLRIGRALGTTITSKLVVFYIIWPSKNILQLTFRTLAFRHSLSRWATTGNHCF